MRVFVLLCLIIYCFIVGGLVFGCFLLGGLGSLLIVYFVEFWFWVISLLLGWLGVGLLWILRCVWWGCLIWFGCWC